ncbi:MAG: PAS-domain containing protein [Rhodocyclaceae bacterium]
MKTNKCFECSERRQLDIIQRVGGIGYWEYDPSAGSMFFPVAALDLLSAIVGGPLNARRPLLDSLSDSERRRFQRALDQAVATRLALHIQLELLGRDGARSCIFVRGEPVPLEQGGLQLAGTFQDITSEKQREADHEKLITQLQALLDALPQGVSVIDKDLRIILWNRRLHEILDVPQDMIFRHARFEDVIRLNALRGDYGPGDPEEKVRAIVARAREFQPHRFERQLAGGRTILVEGFPFRSGGEVSGFVTTYTDITDQKATEEQLIRQRDVMKTIIDNFPGGISLCDTDLRFTTFNDQFMELLDFPPALFATGSAHFEDLARFNVARGEYGPGDMEVQVRAVVERARNFQAHRIERARPNGRWLEIRGTPIASGGFVTSYLDITERKQAEEALQKSEERWKFALEGANDGVWDWNVQTGEVLYSKRWKEMFGYAEDEFANTTAEWAERVHPDDMPHVWATIKQHLHNEVPSPAIEYRMRCKDGSWKWSLGRGMVVSRNDEGKPLRLVGTATDINDRKLIEAELVHAKEAAEARREQVASLLDNSGQGFLSFAGDLVVEAECSRACEAMLGLSPAGRDVADVLFAEDAAKAELLRMTVHMVLAESDPWLCETMLSLLPGEFRKGGKLLKAEYRLLDNARVMVVLTDVTGERCLEQKVESERRRLAMIVAAVTESRDFFDMVDSFREFVSDGLNAMLGAAVEPAMIVREVYRQVHTFKGLMNQFSFTQTPLALHDLESRLDGLRQLGAGVSRQDLVEMLRAVPFAALLDADLAVLHDALGPEFLECGDRIVVSAAQAAQLQQLAGQLLCGEPVDTTIDGIRKLLVEIGQLHKIPFKEALSGFDRLVRQTASGLEKEVAALEVLGDLDVWIDPQAYRPFLRSLTHIFRNAVVHGIEDPETRLESGKAETGSIRCTVRLAGNSLELEIADDGAGIDVDALRRRAVASGLIAAGDLPTLSDEDVLDLVFLDNISTLAEATELAGRGVGLAVVRSEVRNLQGEVVVKTIAGQGTQFLFTLPLPPDTSPRGEA